MKLLLLLLVILMAGTSKLRELKKTPRGRQTHEELNQNQLINRVKMEAEIMHEHDAHEANPSSKQEEHHWKQAQPNAVKLREQDSIGNNNAINIFEVNVNTQVAHQNNNPPINAQYHHQIQSKATEPNSPNKDIIESIKLNNKIDSKQTNQQILSKSSAKTNEKSDKTATHTIQTIPQIDQLQSWKQMFDLIKLTKKKHYQFNDGRLRRTLRIEADTQDHNNILKAYEQLKQERQMSIAKQKAQMEKIKLEQIEQPKRNNEKDLLFYGLLTLLTIVLAIPLIKLLSYQSKVILIPIDEGKNRLMEAESVKQNVEERRA